MLMTRCSSRNSLLPSSVALGAWALLALSGCGSATDTAEVEETSALTVDPLARTADPFQRGLTEADFPRTRELAPGVHSYEQLRAVGEELFTTVSLFIVTDEGVVVADGQGSFEETARMVDEIGKITEIPITHVVICSDHGDHTAGNAAFPEGVEYFVHPNSVPAMEAMAERASEAEDAPPFPKPGTVVSESATLTLGGRTIEILHLGRAHTGGDLVVHLPEESVLFFSEAFLHRIFPAMRSAYPSEWVAMLRRAQELGARWNVPGHGFVDDADVLAEELEVYIGAVEAVIAEATRLHHAGLSAEEAAEAADFGELESWSLRSSQGSRAILQVYRELNGELR